MYICGCVCIEVHKWMENRGINSSALVGAVEVVVVIVVVDVEKW